MVRDIMIPTMKIPKFNFMDYNKSGKKVRTPIKVSVQKELLVRCKGKCENRSCGKSLKGIKPNIHHKDKNPKNSKKSNLVVLCPNCHSKKHLKDKQGGKKGKGTKNPFGIVRPKIKLF